MCFVVVVERLKYARVTRRKTFLHTNLHRDKNKKKRKVYAQPIRLVQDLAERVFPKLYIFWFLFILFIFFFVHTELWLRFNIGLGRSSGIVTNRLKHPVRRHLLQW